jgi:hypothetical protein
MTTFAEDAGNGWQKLLTHRVALMPRTGWRGSWDAFVAFVCRRPQRREETNIAVSVYVKSDGRPVALDLWGMQVEQVPLSTAIRARRPGEIDWSAMDSED